MIENGLQDVKDLGKLEVMSIMYQKGDSKYTRPEKILRFFFPPLYIFPRVGGAFPLCQPRGSNHILAEISWLTTDEVGGHGREPYV